MTEFEKKLIEQYGNEYKGLIHDELEYWDYQDKPNVENQVYLRIASIEPYSQPCWSNCPICDKVLISDSVGSFSTSHCSQGHFRIASIEPYSQPCWSNCPICDKVLISDSVGSFSTSHCSQGHYEYQGCGNYASKSIIIIDGKEETYDHDDVCCTLDLLREIKFYDRIRELRNMKKVSNNYISMI